MEFLGIGAPELIFILIIALILLGPKDMQKAGRTIGVWLNKLVRSDGWRLVREMQNLPTKLMREANMELRDVERDLRNTIEPPSLAGPRAPAPSAPVDPAPPPKANLNPEPNANKPPDAEVTPEPKVSKPPDREDTNA